MIVKKVEPLYRKVGRKYVVVSSACELDIMPVGSWRLTHAATDGGNWYFWDIAPNRAAIDAAGFELANEMARLMQEASKPIPQTGSFVKHTKKQLAALDEAKEILHRAKVAWPSVWEVASTRDIAKAALAALKDKK